MPTDDLFQQPEIGLDWACANVDASVPEAELAIQQALAVPGLAKTPIAKYWMRSGKHDQKLR